MKAKSIIENEFRMEPGIYQASVSDYAELADRMNNDENKKWFGGVYAKPAGSGLNLFKIDPHFGKHYRGHTDMVLSMHDAGDGTHELTMMTSKIFPRDWAGQTSAKIVTVSSLEDGYNKAKAHLASLRGQDES